MAKKIKVYVEPNETVGECLDRIAQMGYRPVRRIEKPVFRKNGNQRRTCSFSSIDLI
ncbi:hypothetical protein L479_01529 [Exiguobacterium sp. S17]|nr:hypothetical protein L479_01529 [Exiguobacterium sp. S17]